MLSESICHYTQALTAFVENNIERNLENGIRAAKGLDECLSAIIENKSLLYEPSWKCFRSQAPDLKEIEKKMSSKKSEFNDNVCSNGADSKFLSSPNCVVRLKYTGCTESGWTMELNQDVSTGDILMVERPWAMSLWKERTKYCCFCCKRCHNLKPCSGCPHVGFCSEECELNARNPAEISTEGNKHVYDCQGLYPLIVLDSDLIHTAFNCLTKVPPNKLLDYIYTTGPYEGGRGHQAFKGAEEIRRVPLEVFDPSDYSAIAFLTTCSDDRRCGTNWTNTKSAVFLTYCLHLAGYPMQWFDETDIFFSDPSSTPRSKVIPASWIAACMLYHIQAVYINAFSITETIRRGASSKLSKSEEYGTAIYPTISLINHSCDPNVAIRFTDKGSAFLYASQPLRSGSEISLTYHPLFYLMSTRCRREILLSRFHFLCKCEACRNDWNEYVLVAPERLVCRNCKEVFHEELDGCPKCKSSESVNMIKHLRKEVIPKLKNCLHQEVCVPAELKYAAVSIDNAMLFLERPSFTIVLLQDLYDYILSRIYGNQTIEQWADMDTSQSS
ncbi:unnamed protein product [Hymenolepis diminuta]|nr:unnamed protein product [Hymenolepis diminuta]